MQLALTMPMKLRPNLLIVDDTQVNLTLLESLLCKSNVNLIQALSGAEALEKVRDIELALAIIDVHMPEMSGYELAVKLNAKRSLSKVPIVFLTASQINEKELILGYKSGAVDYINKPVRNQILMSKINVFIDLFNKKQLLINNATLLKKTTNELISINDALKKQDEKLRGEQLFTKALLNSIPGIFYLYTYPELLMVAWNKRHETLFGFQPEEMEGRHMTEWHLPETRVDVLASLGNVMDSGQVTIETPLMAKDGHLIPFLLTGVKFESNGQTYLIGIGTDTTERQQAVKSLKQSEATLTNAQQIAHLGSWELEDSIHKLQWSDETYRIFGYQPQSICPTMELFFQSVHSDDLSFVQMNLIAAWDTRTSFSLDHRIILSDGRERNVHQQAEILYDKAGNPQKWLGTVQDITERKKSEEEVRSSLEQLKQLSQYIEQVRENERIAISRELHDDLGQALTAVKIDLGIIKRTIGDNEAVSKIIKVTNLVSETIKTVQRLTSQLRPEIIDDLGLKAAIEWYTKEFEQRTGVEVLLDLDPELTIYPENSLTLFRILQESLTNIARHSMATKAEIVLSRNGEFLHFMITDNGSGISQEEVKSKKSFGIISMKERAASMGGTFEIKSENGGGTVIKIILPLNYK